AFARPVRGERLVRLERIELGQAPESGPDTACRALDEPQVLAPAQLEPDVRAPAAHETARLHRIALLRTGARGAAQPVRRAEQAMRRTDAAERRADVHHPLRVRLDLARRQQRGRRIPE